MSYCCECVGFGSLFWILDSHIKPEHKDGGDGLEETKVCTEVLLLGIHEETQVVESKTMESGWMVTEYNRVVHNGIEKYIVGTEQEVYLEYVDQVMDLLSGVRMVEFEL